MTDRVDSADVARGRAFRELVEPEIDVLLRVARSLTGSAADAEDPVQETGSRFTPHDRPSAPPSIPAPRRAPWRTRSIMTGGRRCRHWLHGFRAALILVDLDDLSYAEAAAVLDVPVGTVMSRLSRARDRVRRAVRPTLSTGEENR